LIVRFPVSAKITPGRAASVVRLIDLFPTVLEATGRPLPSGVSGRSLSPLSSLESQDRVSISNISRRVVFRNASWALHLSEQGEVISIHDRRSDPREILPAPVRQDAPELSRLRKLAEAWQVAWRERPEADAETEALPRELRDSLRALGYLD
jgi:arylsulfatase A-like enzyme